MARRARRKRRGRRLEDVGSPTIESMAITMAVAPGVMGMPGEGGGVLGPGALGAARRRKGKGNKGRGRGVAVAAGVGGGGGVARGRAERPARAQGQGVGVGGGGAGVTPAPGTIKHSVPSRLGKKGKRGRR